MGPPSKMRTLMLVVFLGMLGNVDAQQVVRDKAGNFHAVKGEQAPHDSTTTFTYTYQHGPETYTLPVYVSRKGRFYAWRLSGKTGRAYRVYMEVKESK